MGFLRGQWFHLLFSKGRHWTWPGLACRTLQSMRGMQLTAIIEKQHQPDWHFERVLILAIMESACSRLSLAITGAIEY